MKSKGDKWLLRCSYNQKNLIFNHLKGIKRNIGMWSLNYETFVLLGDFNSEPTGRVIGGFCLI